MSRFLTLFALAVLTSISAFGQGLCTLDISITCTGANCSSTVRNVGSNSCNGEYIVGFIVEDPNGQGSVGPLQQTLGLPQCFDASTLPIGLPFALCIGEASLTPGSSFQMSAQITAPSASEIFAVTEVIDPVTEDDLALVYINASTQSQTCIPIPNVPPAVQSGTLYTLSWTPVVDPTATFVVDEATSPDFTANFTTRNVSGTSTQFQHVVTSPTRYYYRVRATTCAGAPGTNSPTVSIVVQPVPIVTTARSGDVVTQFGNPALVSVQFFIPNPTGKTALDTVPFTAATDKPYLTVTPSSGTIPPGGTTVTVTANPANLPPGANTGTLVVTSNNTPVTSKSVSVSLVTPVAPGSTNLPPANALIIPAVAHAPGANGPFQSDVRLTNGGAASVSYQIKFTPAGSDASRPIKTTTVSVDPSQTIALNDILRDFFGVGATDSAGDVGQGALEIRPLNTSSLTNFAASRTFTFDQRGTFGQFVAAIPFSAFATKASVVPLPGAPPPTTNPVLSMQQIAQSSKFRTNLGLVEGSGAPASGTIKVFDDRGTLVKAVPYNLAPGEQRQGNLAVVYGVDGLDDGRIEVSVESSTGAVTAYASVLDQKTNDPLEVTPVQVSQISSSRYIVPGMAALTGTPGAANNFHSDIRMYNGGTAQAVVTATYYPSIGTPKVFGPFSIEPGGVRAFDDVIANQFNANGTGGSIVLTTTAPTSMVATGRTYTIDDRSGPTLGGTFGQFIPGVIPGQGVGIGERGLQILQLEQSTNFRANLGLTELTGNPVDVRVTAIVPESKVGVSTTVHLEGNQFLQLGRVLEQFYGAGANVYNARISVEVIAGSGRVTSYGSVIDNLSADPTFVPPQ